MSSSVSRNENPAAAIEWLEKQFEAGCPEEFQLHRDIISLQPNHPNHPCVDCRQLSTEDGFWWKPPSGDVWDWYEDILMEVEDGYMLRWAEGDIPLPEPAAAFALGPEYPTGSVHGSRP